MGVPQRVEVETPPPLCQEVWEPRNSLQLSTQPLVLLGHTRAGRRVPVLLPLVTTADVGGEGGPTGVGCSEISQWETSPRLLPMCLVSTLI